MNYCSDSIQTLTQQNRKFNSNSNLKVDDEISKFIQDESNLTDVDFYRNSPGRLSHHNCAQNLNELNTNVQNPS